MPRPERSPRRRRLGAIVAALLTTALLASAMPAAAQAFDLAALAALLGRTKAGEASFVEKRRIEMLDRTLESKGRLSFRAPDVFVRETLSPLREKLEVDGNRMTMSRGEQRRTMQLDAVPEAAVIVEAIRGTLTGDRAVLERVFTPTVSGDAGAWTLDLVPRDARLRGQVAQVRVRGRESAVREVQVLLADGDRSTMTIEPLPASR